MEPMGYNSTRWRCNSTHSAKSSIIINQNTVITHCQWLSVTMCHQLPYFVHWLQWLATDHCSVSHARHVAPIIALQFREFMTVLARWHFYCIRTAAIIASERSHITSEIHCDVPQQCTRTAVSMTLSARFQFYFLTMDWRVDRPHPTQNVSK